jgi:hypothetical protein
VAVCRAAAGGSAESRDAQTDGRLSPDLSIVEKHNARSGFPPHPQLPLQVTIGVSYDDVGLRTPDQATQRLSIMSAAIAPQRIPPGAHPTPLPIPEAPHVRDPNRAPGTQGLHKSARAHQVAETDLPSGIREYYEPPGLFGSSR